MGHQQSKDKKLYKQVIYGNTERIIALCRDGASLEWIDKEGKTPLILACMNPKLYIVARTLIELGANVNAYCRGHNAGTPLHHAAKTGLENTVNLLLSHGANAFLMNDDRQTPLDIARAKGFSNIVQAIEGHICLFSGWLRELYGPQFDSRNIWVVVLPCGSRNLKEPFRLELVIYSSLQDAQPRMLIPLWKAKLEEPKFDQPDHSVIIVDNGTKTRIKFAPANERDKQQLQWFCDACKGIPWTPVVQVTAPLDAEDLILAMAISASLQSAIAEPSAPPDAEDLELAMAISASIQSAIAETPTYDAHSNTETNASSSWNNSVNSSSHNSMGATKAPPPPKSSGSANEAGSSGRTGEGKEDGGASSSCVICLDAPVEGACIPCGHMAGCMSCLEEIKAKKWGCPVCRAKIKQVVKLYTV